MILGFLGKGGSGKSSVATQMTLFLHALKKNVLAIDADHNMDLAFNLSATNSLYLGNAMNDLKKIAGLSEDQHYKDAFRRSIIRFSFSPADSDPFTKKYSSKIREGLSVMSAGPQTDEVLYGKVCSHILTTPLKIYLPLLALSEHDEVVVDEKAGADGVTTGIVTGIDVAIIVCEPVLHSIKTANQIAELLKFYDTPFLCVGNKITSQEDVVFIEKFLDKKLMGHLTVTDGIQKNPEKPETKWHTELEKIYKHAQALNKNDRLHRTRKKFDSQSSLNTQH